MKKFLTYMVMFALSLGLCSSDSVYARPRRPSGVLGRPSAKAVDSPIVAGKGKKAFQDSSPGNGNPSTTSAYPKGDSNSAAGDYTPKAPLMNKTVASALSRGHILLNFENIDIRVLARMMSELTGKNIVVDNNVNGKATILSSREVTVAEAWDIFKAAMSRYGFSVVDRNGTVMIIPIQAARSTGTVYGNPSKVPSNEDMVMAVLILKRGDPEEVEKAVKPLLTENGLVSSYKDGRAVVVTDQAVVVNRIAQIVKGLDTINPRLRTQVIFPRYMEAEKVVSSLKNIYKEKEDKHDFAISAFAPSNAVIVSANADDMMEIKNIITRLDIPLSAPTKTEPARFFVYNLQYAQAEDVAKILSEMLSERQKAVEQRLKETKVPATEEATRESKNNHNDVTKDITGPTGKSNDKPTTVGFTSSKVSADTETNSLLLYVSPSEYDELRSVIAKLDCERRQIQISAVVAEVSLQRARDMGVNWQAVTEGGVIGSYGGGLTEEGLLNLLASGNFVAGVSSSQMQTIKVNNQDVKVPGFLAFLSALASNTDYNLISAPRVLTQDNKQAVINVGQVVPFATGGKLDANGQPLVTFDYRDVGIKLEVTPHMSRSGKIRMDVNQEIQEVTSYLNQEMAGVKFSAPIVSNRSVKTTVTIPDGDTLLIGGLIAKKTSDTLKGVPFLRDIPIIGKLFSTTTKEEQKSSIFISLTPKVVDLDDRIEVNDSPLAPYLRSPGQPGDQQHENRDTVLPMHNGTELPPEAYHFNTTEIAPRANPLVPAVNDKPSQPLNPYASAPAQPQTTTTPNCRAQAQAQNESVETTAEDVPELQAVALPVVDSIGK